MDPTVIGRMVEVSADLERVKVRSEGRVVADHPRVWARGATITDPIHVETAAWLRKQFQQPRPAAVAGDDLSLGSQPRVARRVSIAGDADVLFVTFRPRVLAGASEQLRAGHFAL